MFDRSFSRWAQAPITLVPRFCRGAALLDSRSCRTLPSRSEGRHCRSSLRDDCEYAHAIINDIGELSYAARHGHVRDVEPHPNALSCDAPVVGTSSVAPQQLGDAIDMRNIRQHSCDAKCKGRHPNEWLYAAQYPDGLLCAGRDRSDSNVGLHRSESWYAERNRYVWMYEAHSVGPARNSPDHSSPNQPALHTLYFEALLYSLDQTC